MVCCNDPRFHSSDPYNCLRPAWCPRRRLPSRNPNEVLQFGDERKSLENKNFCVKGRICTPPKCTPRKVESKTKKSTTRLAGGGGADVCKSCGQLIPECVLSGGVNICNTCGRTRLAQNSTTTLLCDSCKKILPQYRNYYSQLLSWKYGWIYSWLNKLLPQLLARYNPNIYSPLPANLSDPYPFLQFSRCQMPRGYIPNSSLSNSNLNSYETYYPKLITYDICDPKKSSYNIYDSKLPAYNTFDPKLSTFNMHASARNGFNDRLMDGYNVYQQ